MKTRDMATTTREARRLFRILCATWLGGVACGETVVPWQVGAAESPAEKGWQVVGSIQGWPYFVRGELGRTLPSGARRELDLVAAAHEQFRELAPVFHLNADELVFQRMRVDEQGHRHLRFQQMKNSLKVVGGELVLHLDSEGNLYAANGSARGWEQVATLPRVSPEAAAGVATREAGVMAAVVQSPPHLVYLPGGQGPGPHLAYETRIQGVIDRLPADSKVYVDAERGDLLAVHPQVHTALVRRIHSSESGTTLPGVLRRGEGDAPVGDGHVDEHHGRLGYAYDCYRASFQRDSYDDKGVPLVSTVHFESNFVNAFWNGSQIVFGDGDGVLSRELGRDADITVHELTHAVTDFESDLIYAGESGGLNEAMSDITAAFCESWARGWSTDADVWKVGEDVWTPAIPGDALRYLDDPARDGHSLDYHPDYTPDVGVHYSSGIANLAFKLLATGGSHPRGKTDIVVKGLGMEKAGHIFYKANTEYFTPATTFEQAKVYTEQSAEVLYGVSARESVTQAWAAVGVPPPPPTINALENGVSISGVSGSASSRRYFRLEVPEGASRLVFTTSGGSGDVDMYVRRGALPSVSLYDCRPYANGNSESCSFTYPEPGTWYVMLHSYASYAGVTLRGTHAADGGGSRPAKEIFSGSVAQGEQNHMGPFRVTGGTPFRVVMTGSGDPDLYVRWDSRPTLAQYNCRPYLSGPLEMCDLIVPNGAATANIMARGFGGGDNKYSLTILYTQP